MYWSLNQRRCLLEYNFISPNFCNRNKNKKNYVPLFLLKSILLFHNWCSCQFSSPLLLSHGHSTRQLDPSKLLIRIDQSAVRRQWSSFWIEKKTHSHNNQKNFLVTCHLAPLHWIRKYHEGFSVDNRITPIIAMVKLINKMNLQYWFKKWTVAGDAKSKSKSRTQKSVAVHSAH